MPENANDLYMMFIPYDSPDPIAGGCRTLLDPNWGSKLSSQPSPQSQNPLLTGGSGGMTGFQLGKFIEIEKFGMSASAGEDKKYDEKDLAAALKSGNATVFMEIQRALAAHHSQTSTTVSTRDQTQKSDKPPVGEISFSKTADVASLPLMQSMIKRTGYQSASIVKRKAAGGAASGDIYLRLDFTDVLIVSGRWNNEEQIKEDYKFITRGVKISYKPQMPDGSLGAVIEGNWTAAATTS